jgi:hypothetical protein
MEIILIHLFGAKGYLHYLLSPYGWDFELLRDGVELKEHIERFGPGGIYNNHISSTQSVWVTFTSSHFHTSLIVRIHG